jgi:hypothetical protein
MLWHCPAVVPAVSQTCRTCVQHRELRRIAAATGHLHPSREPHSNNRKADCFNHVLLHC